MRERLGERVVIGINARRREIVRFHKFPPIIPPDVPIVEIYAFRYSFCLPDQSAITISSPTVIPFQLCNRRKTPRIDLATRKIEIPNFGIRVSRRSDPAKQGIGCNTIARNAIFSGRRDSLLNSRKGWFKV